MGKIKVRKWMRGQLYVKYEKGHGQPKHEIKNEHNATPLIHSNATYKTYLAQCNHFADWLSTKGITDPDKAWVQVPEYLRSLESSGKSAWTISTAMNAIAKAWGVSTSEIDYVAPKRERASIKRSRYTVERDSHFSEAANKELIAFCSATGLRRRELLSIHGTDLIYGENRRFWIKVTGKGGKTRIVDVIGSPYEIEVVCKAMQKANDGIVFSHVHSAFDVHYYRSIYACRAYRSKARDIDTLDAKEKYICRKDKSGIVYDRKAMEYASKQLGHNRIDVIAYSYLHNL